MIHRHWGSVVTASLCRHYHRAIGPFSVLHKTLANIFTFHNLRKMKIDDVFIHDATSAFRQEPKLRTCFLRSGGASDWLHPIFLLDALLHTRSELPHSFFTTTRLTACHVDLDLALDLLCFKSVQSLLFLMNPPIVILL